MDKKYLFWTEFLNTHNSTRREITLIITCDTEAVEGVGHIIAARRAREALEADIHRNRVGSIQEWVLLAVVYKGEATA